MDRLLMAYRGLVPPALLILVFSGGAGCESEARKAEKAQRHKAWEDSGRREAETAPPTPEVLEQVRAATKAFMDERHPELEAEGTTLTPLTPNLFLVGVAVHDPIQGNRYVAQLSAERLRDGDWGEEGEAGRDARLLWVVDYADEARMKELAQRHGFGPEVERIRDQDRDYRARASWGQRGWLDNYLLWHYLFHRPGAYTYGSGGFTAQAPGYRFTDPQHPIAPADAERFQSAAAATGGRSMAFLGGSAWRPPPVSAVSARSGQAFVAGPRGGITGKAGLGTVSRGGFGALGRAFGTGT